MLSAEARATLLDQIESLSPSAAVLEASGVDFQTAATLARFIKSGTPDLVALREHGLPLETSVEICAAISARHARKIAALANVPAAPAPKPAEAPAKPAAPAADELDAMSALSQLHTLFEQAEGGRSACITTLTNDGWSESTAKELVKIINAARKAQPRVIKR